MIEKRRKKVLLVITKSNFGGAQRYVYDLAASMPREQFEVVVVFGEGGELEEKLNVAGVRTIRIGMLQRNVSLFKDIRAFFELLRIFKKEKPDVVHLNSTKVGGIGALAGRVCGVPKIIFTAHGWAFNEKRNFISKGAIAILQWITVLLTHTTIAVSQKTASQMLKFPFIGREKIKVIYNGVTDIDFVSREEARRAVAGKMATGPQSGAQSQPPTQPIWIGTTSELHTNKGLDIALTAFAKVVKKYPQTLFVAIGDGQEKINLTNQITKLGLTNSAFLIGFIPDAKKYLKAFDIFTLTSRTEALPYSILEAGLAQLPVIASAIGGIPEIINLPDVGLLVPTGKKASPKITDALANALENLITNPEYAKSLGQNLRQRVFQEFSPQKMHDQTFASYM